MSAQMSSSPHAADPTNRARDPEGDSPIGKALIASGSAAFSLGAAYFVTGSVAMGAVIGGPLLVFAVLAVERTHFSLGATLERGLAFVPFTVVRRPKKQPVIETEKGFLDFERDYLRATKAATRTLQAVGAEMTRVNPRVVAQAAKMQSRAGADVERRIEVADETARILNEHASRFEALENTYRAQALAMTKNLVEMLGTTPATTDLGGLPAVITDTSEQTAGSRQSMAAYRDAVVQMRQMRVSQNVNKSTDRLTAVLDRFLDDSMQILDALSEASTVISRRWPKP